MHLLDHKYVGAMSLSHDLSANGVSIEKVEQHRLGGGRTRSLVPNGDVSLLSYNGSPFKSDIPGVNGTLGGAPSSPPPFPQHRMFTHGNGVGGVGGVGGADRIANGYSGMEMSGGGGVVKRSRDVGSFSSIIEVSDAFLGVRFMDCMNSV